MMYRPEGTPGLLSNRQEAKFWLIGTGALAIVGLVAYGLIRLLGFFY